jgi:tetratricopeptide (TPR) repeat protein
MRGSETSCYGRAVSSLEPALAKFKTVLLKRKGVALGVWGEAGIGKTYQARELLRNLPCQTLSFHATSSWTTLAQSLPEAKKLPRWAAHTLERLRRSESVETKQSLEALTALLATLAPMVVHLEDLHETNSERLESVQELGRRVQRVKGVGLLVTSRSEPPEPFETIRLGPLSREMSDQLLEREVAAELPKEALEWMYSKAVGNPLYTLEYLRFLSRQGFLWNDGKRWHWRRPEGSLVPASVEALIEFTLSDLRDERLETVLQTKAFLPLDADDELFQSVSELSMTEVEEAKRSLERRGIFLKGEFAHPLYREVALEGLSQPKRQQLARRALRALQNNPIDAANFIADANLESAEALELLKRAVYDAKETGQQIRAGWLLARASEYATSEEKGALAFEAAQALAPVDRREAVHLLLVTLEVLPRKAEAIYLLAGFYADSGQSKKGEELLNLLPDDERTQLAWFKHLVGFRFSLGDYTTVLTIWEQQPHLHRDADFTLAYQVGFSHVVTGNYKEALDLAAPALSQRELPSLARARLLTVCGLSQFYSGNVVAAETFLSDAVLAARESGKLDYLASTLHNRSMLYEETNREAEMLADTEEALRLYAEVGLSRHYASTKVKQARILHEMAHYERSEEAFLESRDILLRADHSNFLVTCEAQLSHLYLDWQPSFGDALAQKHAQLALGIARSIGGRKLVLALYHLSMIESRQGRASQGLALAEECLTLAADFLKELSYQALFSKGFALERFGNRQQALSLYREAEQLARNSDWLVYAEKIGLELDHLNNDVESARARMQWFRKRGLMNGVNIACRYFPELAEQPRLEQTLKNVPRLAVLGTMQLEKGQQVLNVRGRKRQDFFALLLGARMSGRSEVSRLDLFDLLYPDIDEEKATGNLRQLVHTLRLELGETVIKTTATGYTLGDITSDAEIFLQTLDTSLWRGCYLDGLDGATRESVQEALYLALFQRAKQLLEDDPKETARLGRLLLEYDPYNADYLRLTLQALRKSDNHRTLGRVYEEAKTHFAELGETLPESWLGFVSSHSRV